MFTRRSTPEIVAGQKDLCPPVFRHVQDEVAPRRTVRVVPPVRKQVLPQPQFIGYFEEPGRYDLIRVDVIDEERDDPGGETCESRHALFLIKSGRR
jgi:hypothetical protein